MPDSSASSPPGIRSAPGAGADVLRDGGNAVDAALGAMLASFACEPLLTGLGAGGYMLVVAPGSAGHCWISSSRRRDAGTGSRPPAGASCIPVSISFGDALQEFNIGAASVGTFGMPAGVCEAARRFGASRWPSSSPRRRRWPATAWSSTPMQAYIIELLAPIVTSTA